MSSRVLSPAEASQIQPVIWRSLQKPEPVAAQPAMPRHPPPPPEVDDCDEETIPVDEAERLRQLAFAEGLRAGEEKCRAALGAEAQAMMERVGKTLVELRLLRVKLRREAEEDLVRLSIAIARRVLHRELQVDAAALDGVVKAALEKLASQSCSKVRTHPSHRAALEQVLARCDPGGGIVIQPDASLQPGDLLFETSRGTLDASVEVQLKEIERGFCDRLRA